MLKHVIFAVAPLCLVASGAFANDDLFNEVASLNADSISSADIEIEDISLDGLDVDALAADAGDSDVDALETCFRRFYRGCYGYRGCYSYRCYRPCYSHYYCYRPVYSYCYTPCYYHYWGCY